LVLPFWYWLTLVVPEKGPLNGYDDDDDDDDDLVCMHTVSIFSTASTQWMLQKIYERKRFVTDCMA